MLTDEQRGGDSRRLHEMRAGEPVRGLSEPIDRLCLFRSANESIRTHTSIG
jgi:hypothetical protein